MLVSLNGELVPRAEARVSVDDRGFLFGDGIYEVARVVDGRLIERDAHLARLARGAAVLRLALPAGGVAAIADTWERLLDVNGLREGEAIVYAQLTRGAAPRAHAFPPADVPPTLYAYAQPLVPPDAQRATGVACVTHPDLRWARCDLKTVNLLPNVLARQAAAEAGAFEAILVRDGVVTEGSLSAVLAVVDGTLRTHPLTERILPSVTRGVVLELAAALGIPAREAAVPLDALWGASEVMVANTTADVMPVVTVDGRAIGDGAPGPVARALGAAIAGRFGRATAAR